MTSIDVSGVVSSMLAAARGVLGEKWPALKEYAQAEMEKLARTFVQIETLYKKNQITEGEASVLFQMQKNTARAVMLTLEGMSLLLVEQALNAALAVVKDVVNGAIGFALL